MGEDVGLVLRRCVHKSAFDRGAQVIGGPEQGQVHGATVRDGGLGEPCRHPSLVGRVGKVLAERGHIRLTIGILDVRQQCRALPHARHAAPEQSLGRTPLGRIHRGLGPHATAEEHRDLLGVDRLVCDVAAMESFHGEGRFQDQQKALRRAQVGEPGPR